MTSSVAVGSSAAIDRRGFLAAAGGLALGAGGLLPACVRGGGGAGEAAGGRVVLYSSVDAEFLRPLIEDARRETGLGVEWVGDTEATKTTGLMQRVLAERDRPRCDVWWSSEPFGTIELARAGVLEPYVCGSAEASVDGGWPARLRGADGTWYGFAQRARVFVVNTKDEPLAGEPLTLGAMLDGSLRGRIGMARPRFGSTRGHIAAILATFGEEALRGWLVALKANGVRLYDGNMSVVRAAASGEVRLGLTDTDDVWAGQRDGWPIGARFEAGPDVPAPGPIARGMGAMVFPNTVALVRGGPNPAAGKKLIDFVLSAHVERALALSDSHNVPVRPGLMEGVERYAFSRPAEIDLATAAASVSPAMRIVDEVLGA